MTRVWRAELTKLSAQWRLRVLLVALAVGPFGFLLALRQQSQLPVDTLFGGAVLDSGFAAPLVVLGFAATWLLPFLAVVVAGEIFAAEDEHGTWSMLLTRGRSRASVFLGKVAAAASVTVVLLGTLAVSSVLAGVLLVGRQPLVDLSGVVLPAGRALLLVLAAWGSVLQKGGNEAQARELVTKIFRNVPVLDSGGRAATTTFTQREIGDVLVTFENEVQLVKKEMGQNFDIVYPASSILAESPVAVVDKVVDRKGNRKQATAYLQYLYTEPAQEVIAQHFFRPRSEAVLKKHSASFKQVKLFTVDEVFGGWDAAQKKHFDDGGEFDKIYQPKK